jgi:hypothetical protein
MCELATNPYFSIHQPALQRYASRQPPRFVENDEIVIILMASEQRADRARMQRETWLRNYPHLFIVGDAEDPSVPMLTLPILKDGTPMRMRSIGSCATCASCTRTAQSCLTSDISSLWVRSLEALLRLCNFWH